VSHFVAENGPRICGQERGEEEMAVKHTAQENWQLVRHLPDFSKDDKEETTKTYET